MFAIDAGKFTSKPDPRKEFFQYFKDSGAAAALQKAMILLFKMPVKPDNLAEYFSEYFENGAQRLMRISLLKAELCYKRDELEKYNIRVQASEERILQLLNKLEISEEEFNERFIPDEIKQNNRLSILERYFKDMERGANKSVSMKSTPSFPTAKFAVAKPRTEEEKASLDLQIIRSDVDLNDIKEIDPWGIICRAPELDRTPTGTRKTAVKTKTATNDRKYGNLPSAVESDMADDDDGATLADIYNHFANDCNLDQDDTMIRLHNQLLTVKKADVTLGDLMGWSPLRRSRDDTPIQSTAPPPTGVAGVDPTERTEERVSVQEGNYFDKSFDENYTDIDKLRRKPCQQRVLKAVQGAMDDETDAFLFEDAAEDDLIENAYKMMEMDGFVFDFPEFSRDSVEHDRGVCKPVCTPSMQKLICSRPSTVGSRPSTAPPRKEGNAATHEDLPIVRVDSSCHCILASAYSASELCDCLTDGEATCSSDQQHPGPVDEDHSKKRRASSAKDREDEKTLAEDAALAKELDEVFKKNRRSSSLKKEAKNQMFEEVDDELQENMPTNVYSVVDLAREIRRTFLDTADISQIDDYANAHAHGTRNIGHGDQLEEANHDENYNQVVLTKHKRRSAPIDPNAPH